MRKHLLFAFGLVFLREVNVSASRVLQQSDLFCYSIFLFCVMRIQVVWSVTSMSFFFLIWRAAPFYFFSVQEYAISKLDDTEFVSEYRNQGEKACTHSNKFLQHSNTHLQHSNTPGKQQHNCNTTTLLHACPCTHLCVHTPTQSQTLAHTRRKKKSPPPKKG